MLPERAAGIADFLKASGWGAAVRAPLAGDASNRRYERLTGADGATAVLMDAPPEKGEDVRPFLSIAQHLCSLGLSAPRVLAADTERGFLLLEDLGDDLYARVVKASPGLEPEIYLAAADALAELHRAPVPGSIGAYDTARMAPLAALAVEWYARGANGEASEASRSALEGAVAEALDRLARFSRPVLVLRDFHAENLLWLPGRAGAARVGLLDFQDALSGHPGYDLVSLVEDARRDVPEAIRNATISHYLGRTGEDEAAFGAALAALGAQRNLRILGVFARLSMLHAKPHYVELIPRVWAHLQHDLAHPELGALAAVVHGLLPEPSRPVLDRLKALCGTARTH